MAAESAAAIGVRHVVKTVSAAGDDGHAAADRLVPGRPGGRPRAGPAVLRRPRGPQARQGGAVRRGRGRAVRRLQHLPRADVAAGADLAARRACGTRSARCRPAAAARACAARTCCAAARSRWRSATTATPASSATTSCGFLRTCDPAVSFRDVTDPLYARRRRRRLDPDAVRRPVHLAARRHPGQGRQDDDGQLAGAAGAVPGHRGVPGRLDAADRPAGHPGADQGARCAGRWPRSSRRTCWTGASSASRCRSGTGSRTRCTTGPATSSTPAAPST